MNAKRVAGNRQVLDTITKIEAEVEAETEHLIHVADVILKRMQPLGVKATIVLAPKDYNCAHFHTKDLRFDPEKHLRNGIFFIPKEDMEQVTVTHGAKVVVGGNTRYYYWNGVRLLDKVCTAEVTAPGLVFNNPKKPAKAK